MRGTISGHDALLSVKAKMFSPARDRKGLLEVFERLTVLECLMCHLLLGRDDGNCNIGSVLSYWTHGDGQAEEERGEHPPSEIHHPENRSQAEPSPQVELGEVHCPCSRN